VEGRTGFVCRHSDPDNLAVCVQHYFESDLFAELETRRSWIMNHAKEHYSWKELAGKTHAVYKNLLGPPHTQTQARLTQHRP
jgi:glycosyltransferase involved in cell wall biosynthesis